MSKPIFKPLDSLQIAAKSTLIINWLITKFNLPAHKSSFRDKHILISIWDGQISISLDLACPEQLSIFNAIPDEYKGVKQLGTGKLVNKHTLYFDLNKEFEIPYPTIEAAELIEEWWFKGKKKAEDSDDFKIFRFHLHLSDNTIMEVTTEDETEPINLKYTFPSQIQSRFFFQHIETLPLKVIKDEPPLTVRQIAKREFEKHAGASKDDPQAWHWWKRAFDVASETLKNNKS